jgi:hypothetical protein
MAVVIVEALPLFPIDMAFLAATTNSLSSGNGPCDLFVA